MFESVDPFGGDFELITNVEFAVIFALIKNALRGLQYIYNDVHNFLVKMAVLFTEWAGT